MKKTDKVSSECAVKVYRRQEKERRWVGDATGDDLRLKGRKERESETA